MALPTFVAAGAGASSGSANIAPALPAGFAADDIHILLVQTGFSEVVATPAGGWAHVTGSPLTTTSGGTGPHRLAVFWKLAVGGDTAPTVVFVADHHIAQISGFRGCATTGNPWNQVAMSAVAASTSVSVPGVTTTVADCLCVYIVGNGSDNATTPRLSSVADASLANITAVSNFNAVNGTGGGFDMVTGQLATAGASGTLTATIGNTKQTLACIALYPPQGDTTFVGMVPI
jgi:hypothetical protein